MEILKINDKYIMRKIMDDYIVVPVGATTQKMNGMITLNETSAFLWERLVKGITKEQLISDLLEEYDVSREIAVSDIDKFLNLLCEKGIMEYN